VRGSASRPGCFATREEVAEFRPDENLLLTVGGGQVSYDYLVVAAGIQVDWDKIKGLQETIGKNGVCSNYSYQHVDSTWEAIRNFRGGNAIFTAPNTPVKCGGAPQKIMYLAERHVEGAHVGRVSDENGYFGRLGACDSGV
jgi:sulfide:quinone oxidoreductase